MKYIKKFRIVEGIENDDYYCDDCIMYHSTTKENLEKIKIDGKLKPQNSYLNYNKLYLSSDSLSQVRMIIGIADEKENFKLDNIVTLFVRYPCMIPENSDGFDIEYKDLYIDNDAGDAHNYYTDKEISLDRIINIIPFLEFKRDWKKY